MLRLQAFISLFTALSFGLVLAQEGVPPSPEFPEIPKIELFQEMENLPEIELAPEIEALTEFNLLPELDISSEGIPFAEAYVLPQEEEEGDVDETPEKGERMQQRMEDKDQKKMSETVAKLKQNRLQLEQNRVQFLAKADKILSAEQQAKFLLFQNRFEGRLRAEIMDLRQPQIYKHLQKPFLELELQTLHDRLQKLHDNNFKEQDFDELKARLEESQIGRAH